MEFKVPATGAEWRSAPRVCRCCLSEGCYKDISTEYYWMGEKETYAEMLKECFDLTISLQDAANSNGRLICEVCITRLRDATNFKKQVVRSEQRFAEHLQSGASLSTISVTEGGPYQEVKVEGVKDEMLVSDDDDVDDGPVDDDTLDPDYDESDSLPLKYEVQKKEALVELSFGDEIPTLSNTETTIRRVSAKGKDKSPAKKLKLNKKELTIKPVKASGSKVKAAKAPKAPKVPKAPKPAKPATKKGVDTDRKDKKIFKLLPLADDSPQARKKRRKAENLRDKMSKRNACILLEYSHVSPFKWLKNGFLCFFCDTKYTDPKALREHTRVNHADEIIMDFVGRVKKHDLVKVDVARVDCRLCPEPVHCIDSLKRHLLDCHDKKIKADYGDGVIPYKLDTNEFQCHLCKIPFNVFITLNNHMNSHYTNYICETCGKGFATGKRLASHALSHQTGVFPCAACGESFPSRAARTNHTNRAHREAMKFKCPQCGECFKSYLERNKHRRLVHNVTSLEYKCSMCPKVFPLAGKRTYHIKQVHMRERNHSCSVCEWKFFSKTELQDHMIKHGGERIYECAVCKKSYARKPTLREHMRIHSDDRRFVCPVCGKAFVQNCSRKYHMKAHHPEEVVDGAIP